jgi:hypothetical protein
MIHLTNSWADFIQFRKTNQQGFFGIRRGAAFPRRVSAGTQIPTMPILLFLLAKLLYAETAMELKGAVKSTWSLKPFGSIPNRD